MYSSSIAFFSSMIGWRRTCTFVRMAGSSSMKSTPRLARKTPVPAKASGSFGLMPRAMACMSFKPRSFASFVYSLPCILENLSWPVIHSIPNFAAGSSRLPAARAHALLRPLGVIVVRASCDLRHGQKQPADRPRQARLAGALLGNQVRLRSRQEGADHVLFYLLPALDVLQDLLSPFNPFEDGVS